MPTPYMATDSVMNTDSPSLQTRLQKTVQSLPLTSVHILIFPRARVLSPGSWELLCPCIPILTKPLAFSSLPLLPNSYVYDISLIKFALMSLSHPLYAWWCFEFPLLVKLYLLPIFLLWLLSCRVWLLIYHQFFTLSLFYPILPSINFIVSFVERFRCH